MADMPPSGLASISSQFDDFPQVRGAVAFGRMEWQKKSFAEVQQFYTDTGRMAATLESDLTSAIDRHAALVIGSAYRSADRR